jgi:hypothetical protein
MFVDCAGQRPKIVDPKAGEVTEVELFVSVLGAVELHLRRGDRSLGPGL